MKKRLVLLCLLSVFFISKIHAQNKDRSFIQLGAKMSPNISWLNSNSPDITSDGTSARFSWGFIADFRFAEKYYFSTGFNINSIGGRIIYADSSSVSGIGSLHRNISTRYVEFPVSVKMKTRQFGYFTIFGQIGLGLGLKLSANSDDDFFPSNSSAAISKKDIKIEDQINFFRLSMLLSAGVEYNLGGSTSLFGAINFNNGFNNIFNYNKPSPPALDADASSNSLELSIGILF